MTAEAGPAATRFRVRAPRADRVELALFIGGAEQRLDMTRDGEDWACEVPGNFAGCGYGFRAHGTWAPDAGLWFDPAKLLVDPHAVELDRAFRHDAALSVYGVDTAPLVPRARVPGALPTRCPDPPRFGPGALIYEVPVRALTMLHPEIAPDLRGTVAALAHPAIIAHLQRLGVDAVELMPIVAWIDERHLPPLGLSNAWGYNPVVPMALDPRLCPGGVAELQATVAALHAAGIGVVLDLVFNHTGESDRYGPVLSLRGLDATAYAHHPDGSLVNHTGCGNTLDFQRDHVRALVLDTLRHFVRHAGIDGFRFDLAPIIARGPDFSPNAPIFAEIAGDPWLCDRVMIAEPWDIGPGGYRLGGFPPHWLEWNDRWRDDVRRFWRGDGGVGTLATRLAGSSDVFGPCADTDCRSVNFLAAHDGFTLADTLAYATRHNLANGEDNRDGHGENFSWNSGCEGPSSDPAIVARRAVLARAMLGTLFAATGTIMLSAGDEFGRTQHGNNNAYAQDNALTWLNWATRDRDLEAHVAALAAWRRAHHPARARFPETGLWHDGRGAAMTAAAWELPATQAFGWRSDTGAGFAIDRAQTRVDVIGAGPAPGATNRF